MEDLEELAELAQFREELTILNPVLGRCTLIREAFVKDYGVVGTQQLVINACKVRVQDSVPREKLEAAAMVLSQVAAALSTHQDPELQGMANAIEVFVDQELT